MEEEDGEVGHKDQRKGMGYDLSQAVSSIYALVLCFRVICCCFFFSNSNNSDDDDTNNNSTTPTRTTKTKYNHCILLTLSCSLRFHISRTWSFNQINNNRNNNHHNRQQEQQQSQSQMLEVMKTATTKMTRTNLKMARLAFLWKEAGGGRIYLLDEREGV